MLLQPDTDNDGQERLFLHRKWNILDHDGGRDDLIVDQLANHSLSYEQEYTKGQPTRII
jgi:hypothetical protein